MKSLIRTTFAFLILLSTAAVVPAARFSAESAPPPLERPTAASYLILLWAAVAVALHLIPETLNYSLSAFGWIVGGFAAMVLIGIAVQFSVSRRAEGAALTFGYASIIGLGAHSLLDGVIYAAAFNDDLFTGWIAAIGLMLHEFPEGIVTFVLLERGGFSRRKAVSWSFLAAAVSTPLGTLVSYPFINRIQQSTLGILLAISAGALVYVGASHLLPAVEAENRKYSILALIAGVLVAVCIVMSKG